MKHSLKLWYGVTRTIKSVEYQMDEDCKKFKENTIELNKALHLLIGDLPIPESGLKYSNQLKRATSCLMGTPLTFLQDWRTLGGVDEQHVEGIHPAKVHLASKKVWKLSGRTTLGQKKVFKGFLFMNSTFIVECIEDRMEKTRRKKGKNKNR